MKCNNCGNEIENGSTYCYYCNTEINPSPKGKVCPNCGYVNVSNAKFCKSCGTQLTQTTNINQTATKSPSKNSRSTMIIFIALGIVIVLLCIALTREKTSDNDSNFNDNSNQISDDDPYYNQDNPYYNEDEGTDFDYTNANEAKRTKTLNTLINYLNNNNIATITDETLIFDCYDLNTENNRFYEFRTDGYPISNMIGIYGISNDGKNIFGYNIPENYIYVIYPIEEEQYSNSNNQVSLDGYSYSAGTYKLLYSIKIRKGPGTDYDRLIKSDLPSEYYGSSNENGGLNPDTIIEVSEVTISENRVWGKISCGWVCLYDEKTLVEKF